MKFFIFSSPYQYYADNLIPVAKELSALGHEVVACYRLSETGSEFEVGPAGIATLEAAE